jgi:KDO2-lipid IV(A) lauroyltransferase
LVGRPLRRQLGETADNQLAAAYGDEMSSEERKQVAKEVGDSFGYYIAENLAILHHGTEVFKDRVEDQAARETFERFQENWDGGALGITAHIGNWEMTAQWVDRNWKNRLGGVVAKRTANQYLDKIIVDFRSQTGLPTIYQDESPAKSIRVLKAGKVIGILPDQDLRNSSGIFIDFFGRPAYTPIGPARLALAARVPMFTAFCLRSESGFKMVVNEPIYPDFSRPRNEEILRLTKAWSEQVESVIRSAPGQWAWFHSRWRTTPEKLKAHGRERS